MKTYKIHKDAFQNDRVRIGDEVEVDSNYVTIIKIIEVDLENNIVWFIGA